MKTLISVKVALISRLLNELDITSMLTIPTDIRELEYQGNAFRYPNIRIRINTVRYPGSDDRLCALDVDASIIVFNEHASSFSGDAIASKIVEKLHGKSFMQGDVRLSNIICVQHGADKVEESNLWVSVVNLSFKAM